MFENISKKSEKISEKHLKLLLEVFGKKNAACEAKQMIEITDLGRVGFIDFNVFVGVHKKA